MRRWAVGAMGREPMPAMEAAGADASDGGGWGRGVGWDEEVEGGSYWQEGARWGEGRRPRGRVEVDPTEYVATAGEVTGGGGQGDGGRRRGGVRCCLPWWYYAWKWPNYGILTLKYNQVPAFW